MEELLCDEDGEMEWKETARYVKIDRYLVGGQSLRSKIVLAHRVYVALVKV